MTLSIAPKKISLAPKKISIAPDEITSYPSSNKPRREQLTARWLVIDGKLVCRWVIE